MLSLGPLARGCLLTSRECVLGFGLFCARLGASVCPGPWRPTLCQGPDKAELPSAPLCVWDPGVYVLPGVPVCVHSRGELLGVPVCVWDPGDLLGLITADMLYSPQVTTASLVSLSPAEWLL